MRHKWKIILALMLLLLGLAYYLQGRQSNKLISDDAQVKIQDDADSETDTNEREPSKPTIPKSSDEPLDLSTKNEIEGIPMSKWLAEIKNPVYSDDAVIEVASLSMDLRKCNFPFFNINQRAKTNPKMRKLMDEVNLKCQSFAQKYPMLYEVKDREKILTDLPANSLFGERFKYIIAGYYGQHRELNFDELNEARIELSLQIKSPGLISFAAIDRSIGLAAPPEVTAVFADLLQSKEKFWLHQTNELAMQSLTCDLNNSHSCEASSFYMLYKCDAEPAACGLSFQQWFENFTTDGMKKDVAIIKQYYLEKYP